MKTIDKLSAALLVLGLGVAASGCTDTSDTQATNDATSDSIAVGDVDGQSLVVEEAIAFRVDGADSHGVAVVLSDRPGVCAALQNHAALADATTLTLFVPDHADSAIDDQGTRALSADLGGTTTAVFGTHDAQCKADNAGLSASIGRIDLSAIDLADGARTQGTFDLHFGDDALVGKFAAVHCAFKATSPNPLSEVSACQ